MKKFLNLVSAYPPSAMCFNVTMLLFRVAVSIEMIRVHGLKKIGYGGSEIEHIGNPFHFPDWFNQGFGTAADLVFPCLVLVGFLTRLATLPTLAVTLTGFFIMHWNDSPALQDTPYMYSVAFLLIFILGPGEYSVDFLLKKRRPTI